MPHIVDVLIEERAQMLSRRPLVWRSLKTLIYPLLGYERAIEMADTIRDMIEARGVGILASPASPAWARAVVDLDKVEKARLPEARETVIAGARLPLLRKVESPAFPAMLKLYLLGGVYGDARSRSED